MSKEIEPNCKNCMWYSQGKIANHALILALDIEVCLHHRMLLDKTVFCNDFIPRKEK